MDGDDTMGEEPTENQQGIDSTNDAEDASTTEDSSDCGDETSTYVGANDQDTHMDNDSIC